LLVLAPPLARRASASWASVTERERDLVRRTSALPWSVLATVQCRWNWPTDGEGEREERGDTSCANSELGNTLDRRRAHKSGSFELNLQDVKF
jgi:hypothetical protein